MSSIICEQDYLTDDSPPMLDHKASLKVEKADGAFNLELRLVQGNSIYSISKQNLSCETWGSLTNGNAIINCSLTELGVDGFVLYNQDWESEQKFKIFTKDLDKNLISRWFQSCTIE